MPEDFDFIRTTDKPALLAFSTPAWLEASKVAVTNLGYKVHTAATHSDFISRFSQVHYQVVLLEETFGAEKLSDNASLKALQLMPMRLRRHATVILLGDSFQTFTPMQAFEHSVNAVINISELFILGQLIEKAVSDHDFFFNSYFSAEKSLHEDQARQQ